MGNESGKDFGANNQEFFHLNEMNNLRDSLQRGITSDKVNIVDPYLYHWAKFVLHSHKLKTEKPSWPHQVISEFNNLEFGQATAKALIQQMTFSREAIVNQVQAEQASLETMYEALSSNKPIQMERSKANWVPLEYQRRMYHALSMRLVTALLENNHDTQGELEQLYKSSGWDPTLITAQQSKLVYFLPKKKNDLVMTGPVEPFVYVLSSWYQGVYLYDEDREIEHRDYAAKILGREVGLLRIVRTGNHKFTLIEVYPTKEEIHPEHTGLQSTVVVHRGLLTESR